MATASEVLAGLDNIAQAIVTEFVALKAKVTTAETDLAEIDFTT